jgi:hypothetical protein
MTEATALTCPKCAAACQPLTRFCEACGAPLEAGAKPRRNAGAQAAARRTQETTAKNIRSARIALGFVALVTLGFTIFMQARFDGQVADARANPQMTVDEAIVSQQHMLFTVNYLLVAVYVGLLFWCGRNPFAACLTGLVIYVTLILINAALDPATIIQGIIMKIIVIAALANGVKAGLAHRRQLADAADA